MAARYCTTLPGFRDYEISRHITEKCVIGGKDAASACVYIVWGWNENDALNETDSVESDCFLYKADAVKALSALQKAHPRTQ